MIDLPAEPLGAAWLARAYGVRPLGRSPVTSQVGGRRATRVDEGFRLETYTEAMRPAADPAAHLQFHLRHEVPHLEFLARLFEQTGPGFVQAWVTDRTHWPICPSGGIPVRVADGTDAGGAGAPGRQLRRGTSKNRSCQPHRNVKLAGRVKLAHFLGK